MSSTSLFEAISENIGLTITSSSQKHLLSGIFNRYRPHGTELQNILPRDGIDGEIAAKIMTIFDATASSWDPHDLYFTVKKKTNIGDLESQRIAEEFLAGIRKFAEFTGDLEIAALIGKSSVAVAPPHGAPLDQDLAISIYECVTDYLAKKQPKPGEEALLLKEAVYSMANDYFLVAYVFSALLDIPTSARAAFDRYFELWAHGVKLRFFVGGMVTASQSATDGHSTVIS